MNTPGSRDPAADKPNPFARAETPASPRNPAQEREQGGGVPPGSDGGAEDRFLTPAPSVSLPQGGGAIRGIGETFRANAITGTAGMQVPVAVSPSPRGLSPQLSLSYDSGAGNGPFGMGWQLSTASIRRKTDRGLPRYRDTSDGQGESDVFQLAGAEDLVPWLDAGSPVTRTETEGPDTFQVVRYRPRIEGAFARIERWTHTTTGDVHWRTHASDNSRRIFGRSAAARVADPDDPSRIFQWLLEEVYDELGNTMLFTYVYEDRANVDASQPSERARGQAGHQATYTFLQSIYYGNKVMGSASVSDGFHFRLEFDYGEHTTAPPTTTKDTTWPVRSDPYSSFRAGFDHRCYRLCRRVLVFHDFAELGTGWTLVKATEFAYDEQPHCTKLTSVTHRGYVEDTGVWSDLALPPVAFTYTEASLGTQIDFLQGVEDLPKALDVSQYQWVDLDGEGLTGLLTEQGGAWFYKRNEGQGSLGPMKRLGTRPAVAMRGARLMDLGGNGQLNVVQTARPPRGFYERDLDGGWESFRPFKTVPNVNMDDANVRMLDLDGDGFADLMVTEDRVFRWYRSEAKDGYGHAEQRTKARDEDDGPTLVFGNESEHIFLADMTGDGLTDLVRIRRTSVEYWPNRGYGRFGARIVVGNVAAFDRHGRFDPRRIRLADVDGSGPTDLLYLGADGVDIYVNESGNALAARARLQGFPAIDNVAQVSVADLLGDGTACLVWSSPLLRGAAAPLRYVRLMADGKPHLLRTITNNLGRTTTLSYTPSTVFYAADRRAGRPWATRLPFPVLCLSKVEMDDGITGWRFASTYTYHHGYFDGPEREFRGFGLVVQRDTESVTDFEGATNQDVAHDIDPVVTKTWFHTGAWRHDQRLSDAYAAEAWSGDSSAASLPAPSVPIGLSVQEQREAYRALRGSPLRVEVYAEDGDANEGVPYTVSTSTYEVVRIQEQGELRHGVFQLLSSQSLALNYERDADDPRVTHSLVLDRDAYNHPTLSAEVGYPRRSPDTSLSSELQAEQAKTHIIISEASLIHQDGPSDPGYHLAVPMESKSWELTGLPGDDTSPFSASELVTALGSATEIDFESFATGGTMLEKRMLSWQRTFYWKDDLLDPQPALALGTLESRALPHHAEQLVLTGSLVTNIFGTKLTDTHLTDAGYTKEVDGSDVYWWMESGTAVLDDLNFYQPTSQTDPFGNTTSIAYDTSDSSMLITKVTNALTHEVTADIDYRVLAPSKVTDPNGATSEAAFDELGRVTKMWVGGTSGEGDTSSNPTTKTTYEMDLWFTSGMPNRVKSEAREEHHSENASSAYLVSYAYSDGHGNVVMQKAQAEDGLAPERDGNDDLVFDQVTGELSFVHSTDRWVGSGRTVLDNKGNVVKQYEPFFSDRPDYEDDDKLVEWGVSPIMTYDPLGRAIRTDLPDGTYAKVVFDGWSSQTWDAGDTVADSDWYAERNALGSGTEYDQAQLDKALFGSTPTTTHVDALGRTVATIAHNRIPDLTASPTTYTDAFYTTRVVIDVAGQVHQVIDPRGIINQRHHTLDGSSNPEFRAYSLLNQSLYSQAPDAGERWMLSAIDDQPAYSWQIAQTGTGVERFEHAYDTLRRPTQVTFFEAGGTSARLHETAYDDTGVTYAKGRPTTTKDQAGEVSVNAYDFKGQATSTTRTLLTRTEGKTRTDWAGTPALESTGYTSTVVFDALGRPKSQTAPDGSVTAQTFNKAGLLETVSTTAPGDSAHTVISGVSYDAKGQRTQIVYGSGVTTDVTYDPETWRITRIRSKKSASSDAVQDLRYTYNAPGSIVQIDDEAHDGWFIDNASIDATQTYAYDALGRLVQATGRERDTNTYGYGPPPSASVVELTHKPTAYTRRYSYDGVGNVTETKSVGQWTRSFSYASTDNRLASTTVSGTTTSFAYTNRGAMTTMPHLVGGAVTWDEVDHIRSLALPAGNSAHYTYDATRERVRKVVEKGAITEERIYLGSYEVFRKYSTGVLQDERLTLHVHDPGAGKRVLMVERLTLEGAATKPGTPRYRYQLGNHLGTAAVETDETGDVITYEEFYPYGGLAWTAEKATIQVSAKRYRYIGKERDEESGLNYHSARYYMPWLGRWCSADPGGLIDGVGRYGYCRSNPVKLKDRSGFGTEEDVDYDTDLDSDASGPQVDATSEWSRGSVPTPETEAEEQARENDIDDDASGANGHDTAWEMEHQALEDVEVGKREIERHRREQYWIRRAQRRSDLDLMRRGIIEQRGGATNLRTGEWVHPKDAAPMYEVPPLKQEEAQRALGGAAALGMNIAAGMAMPAKFPVFKALKPPVPNTSMGAGRLTTLSTKHSGVELAAASDVAKMGRDVVMRDPNGTRSVAGGTADLLVDGVPMDIYSPQAGTSVKKVLQRTAGKNNQAQGVILDLSVWDGSMDELGDILARVQGKLRADGSPVNIQEIIVTGR